MTRTLLKYSKGVHLFEIIQRPQLNILLPEHVSFNPIGQESTSLVRNVFCCRYGKNVVEFFKRSLFRFRHEEEDHYECNHIQPSIKSEC